MRNWKPFCMGTMIESHPNPEFRTVHFKIKILNGDDYIGEYGSQLTKKRILTMAMIDALKKIEGVKAVSVKPYEIDIKLAPMYSWEELVPAIKSVMAKYYPSKSAE